MSNDKFFFLTLKKRLSKNGAPFYTAKYAYAVDLVAFEKKDGSGDLTIWLQPKDMNEMKQQGQQRQQPQRQPAPRPQQPRQQYKDFTQPPPPEEGDPGPDDFPF